VKKVYFLYEYMEVFKTFEELTIHDAKKANENLKILAETSNAELFLSLESKRTDWFYTHYSKIAGSKTCKK